VSSQPFMLNRRLSSQEMFDRSVFKPRQAVRAILFYLSLFLVFSSSASLAYGQSFGLSIPLGLNRPAVDPGGSAIGTIDLTSSNGFSSPVALSCALASGPVTTDSPACTVSPASQVPPADGPSLTIATTNNTSVGLYTFTVTGTSGAITQTVSVNLTVQPLSQDYTIAASPTTAVPNPVAAGTGATTTVTVTPIGSYSGHNVTLACLSITPVVALAPVCTFNPATVAVNGGPPPTSVLTITTTGPAPVTRLGNRRIFYAFWLVFPGLGVVALSTSRGRLRKRLFGVCLLGLIVGGVAFAPACGSSNTSIGSVTPNQTYAFTLTGADENGAAPSNTTTNQATVSITVN